MITKENIFEKPLSPRQNEVLILLRKGMRHKEVGEALDLDIKTVSANVRRIYAKYGVDADKNLYYLINTLIENGVINR